MLLKKRSRVKNAWKLIIPAEFSSESYVIRTSPVVLGCSGHCDIVIKDPSVAESHIQFVLVSQGKFLEIYSLAGDSGEGPRTMLDGGAVEKTRIKAVGDKFFTLKAGNVHLRLMYAPVRDSSSVPSGRAAPRVPQVQWFFLHGGVEYGPMTESALARAFARKELLPLDDVWHSGLDRPMRAYEMPALLHDGSRLSKKKAEPWGKLRCPCCWHNFLIEDVMYISRHPDLTGDPVLGSEEPLRFLPRDLKPVRRALDSRGEVCSEMACPRCHLRIPTPFIDTVPLFLSIIGIPGSGKSYYLASATWRLRKILPRYFNISFEDIDNMTNQWLNAYEEALFFARDRDEYHVIEKTQIEASGLSRQVKINNITMLLPQPAIFTLVSKSHGGNDGDTPMPSGNMPLPVRTLAVYDNAGEHFQTGQDVIEKPGTLHMLHAHGFIFLFDPTADPRFGSVIDQGGRDGIAATVYQQQKIVIETMDRVRKYTGLNVTDKVKKPVVAGLSKFDLLQGYFAGKGIKWSDPPIKWIKRGEAAALDMSLVRMVSDHIREFFYELSPEYVNTIESFAHEVVYLPVSAIGHQPGTRGVNTGDVNPLWVEVPFLYILSRHGHIRSAGQDISNRGRSMSAGQDILNRGQSMSAGQDISSHDRKASPGQSLLNHGEIGSGKMLNHGDIESGKR
ncbi:MAG: DUF4339 domain-containing protein [Desulfamplus sp.]|nr:DUF4339 domain-containing protein [Desulfamplus sp.]